MEKRFCLQYALAVMLIACGCSQSVTPTELNLGIPPGAGEGEYGYNLGSKIFDSRNLSINGASVSLSPYPSLGAAGVELSLNLFFDFRNGNYGSTNISLFLDAPTPRTLNITTSSSIKSPRARASIDYHNIDSNNFIWYQASVSGTVTITKFDTNNNLVSGYFEITASETSPNNNPQAIMHITSGYFNDLFLDEGAYGQGSVTATINDSSFSANRWFIDCQKQNNALYIFANTHDNLLQNISIQNLPLDTGTYFLDQKSGTPVFLYSDMTAHYGQWKFSSQQAGASGMLTIASCNIVNHRLSGTFQFNGIDSSGEVISITSGQLNNIRWGP